MQFHKIVLILVVLVFLASTVSSARLYPWGTAQDISIDTTNGYISSYDGFSYYYGSDGTVRIVKDGAEQGSFQFGMSAMDDKTPVVRTSSEYEWDWTVVSNTAELIELQGIQKTYATEDYKWSVTLTIGRYASLKINNYIENASGRDLANTNFFYLFSLNPDETKNVGYYDSSGDLVTHSYNPLSISPDTKIENKEIVSSLDQNKITTSKFNFNFQDVIDTGYDLNYLYFGKLDTLYPKLSVTDGYAIGIEKDKGVFADGVKYEIDPTITVPDALDGYIRFNDGVFSTETPNDLITGHSGQSSVSRIYRAILQFNIDGLGTVNSATLNLFTAGSSLINGETCTFDLNSITDINTPIAGIDGNPANDPAGGDWNSTTFSIAINDWLTEADADTNVSGSVTTVWNDNNSLDRNYLAFRLALEDEHTFTDVANDCRLNLCVTGNTSLDCDNISTNPFIEYTLSSSNTTPDINLLSPNGNQYVGGTDVNISFNVQDEDLASETDGALLVDLYYSTNPQEFGNLIASDINLMQNNACDDTNFTVTPTHCTYLWNTDGNSIADGNYYIDLNISDDSDANAISSSAATFFLDNSIPDIYIWQPLVDAVDSNTLVTFDVNENSLVTDVAVNLNSAASGDFVFATHCALFDINYHCSYIETGFVANVDNNLSILGTNTIGDTNQSDLNFVYNTTPSITVQAPDGNQYLGGDDINISFSVTDTDLNGNIIDGLFVSLYYSPTSGGFTNAIVEDLNLFAGNCDTNDFSSAVNCAFVWNADLNTVGDGNFFIDANVYDRYDFNAQDSSDASFFMDNSAPDIHIIRPAQGSTVEARQIDFNVMENGKVSTITTLINGTASTSFVQGTHCTLFDINYICSYVEEDIKAGDNNISIRATNTGGGADRNEFSATFSFNDPSPGGGGVGITPPPPSPEKRFEIVSIPETVSASRGIGTEFRITIKNISNDELQNFEIRFNEEIAPLINTILAPEVIGAGELLDFVYRITPEEDSESQTLVVFFFDGSFADSQEISVLVIDNPLLFAIAGLNSPAFNFGDSVINWNILLFVIVVFAFLAFINPLPKQLISLKILTLVVLAALLISAVAGA